jgi:hypothetical protein
LLGSLKIIAQASRGVPLFLNWHMAAQQNAVLLQCSTRPMPLANWTDLEQRGLIQPSPGREEAAKATLEWAIEKRKAEREAFLNKATPAQRRKRK